MQVNVPFTNVKHYQSNNNSFWMQILWKTKKLGDVHYDHIACITGLHNLLPWASLRPRDLLQCSVSAALNKNVETSLRNLQINSGAN